MDSFNTNNWWPLWLITLTEDPASLVLMCDVILFLAELVAHTTFHVFCTFHSTLLEAQMSLVDGETISLHHLLRSRYFESITNFTGVVWLIHSARVVLHPPCPVCSAEDPNAVHTPPNSNLIFYKYLICDIKRIHFRQSDFFFF